MKLAILRFSLNSNSENNWYFLEKSINFPYIFTGFFMAHIRFRFPYDIAFYPKHYISHLLIAISVVVAFLGFLFPILKSYFGLHEIPLFLETIPFLLGQILLYQFLHGDILHIAFNSYFLYQAGPEVEARMSRSEFVRFFLANTLFVAGCLWFLSDGLTIGISGFCMALLAYLYMDMRAIRHPMAWQILVMLIINILLWLTGNISFVGHAAGAFFGYIYWIYRRR